MVVFVSSIEFRYKCVFFLNSVCLLGDVNLRFFFCFSQSLVYHELVGCVLPIFGNNDTKLY